MKAINRTAAATRHAAECRDASFVLLGGLRSRGDTVTGVSKIEFVVRIMSCHRSTRCIRNGFSDTWVRMRVAALAAAAAAFGCRGIDTPRPAAPSTPFVVSTPHPDIAATLSESRGDLAWVALPAGTLPHADVVTIRLASTGQTVTARASDGGLDPVPVSAAMGDELQLTVTKAGSSDVASYDIALSGSKGPIVIRISPPPKKRDVPLNAVIVIVFSEPIFGASLTPSAVSLTIGGAPVAGQLGFADSTHVTALFIPNAPLIPATDYTLTVTQGIRNVDGQTLREPVVIQFRTTDSSSTPPSGVLKFHVSGTVTDDADTPLSGTYINFWINPLPGQRTPGQVIATTDADGKFTADLNSVFGSASGPPGTADAIAFAFATKDGVSDNRYVLASGISDLRFKLYRAPRIIAGDSVLVTITPNDGVCVNNTQDMHPWPQEWRCRTIHVSPSAVDGSMRIAVGPCQTTCETIALHAEPMDTVVNGARLRADSLYNIRFGNWLFDSLNPATGTLTVPIAHGISMLVDVEMPWLNARAETFWLRTSFAPAP